MKQKRPMQEKQPENTGTDSSSSSLHITPNVGNSARQDQLESGLGSGGSRSSSWGTAMDSFQGVVAYSNGSQSGVHSNARQTEAGETRYGLKYQCVEYVNRYSVLANGTGNMIGTGNAIDYARPRGFGYTWIENKKDDNLPQLGDIIVFGGGSYGHVAIATNTSTSSVGIIQQNTDSVRSNIAVKDGKLQNWGSMTVLGWQTQNPSTASSKTPTVSTVVPPAQSTTSQTYTVRSGDTLWKIAEKQLGDGNRYPELAAWNSLANPSQLRVGQVLKLSDPQQSTTKPKEEPTPIDNTQKEEALLCYAIEPTTKKSTAQSTQEQPKQQPKASIKKKQYTVQKGDSLWRIAQNELGNGARYKEIVALNKMNNPNSLSIGTVLLLP